MTFGLSLTGFLPKRVEDVIADLESAMKAAFGNNVRLDPKSVNGQLIGIFAERYADLWEAAEDVYLAAYAGSASGSALDDLVALAGIERDPATLSVVTLTLGGTPGTLIPAGSASNDPALGIRWVHVADATIGGGGTIAVIASPEDTGPILGLSGTITEIATPVSGWSTVTNALDATPGRAVETDAALRERFILSFRAGGGSSVEAIRAVILGVEGVTYGSVIENDTDHDDDEGRPPHSFEVIVVGGDNQDLADAIWFSKPAGIQPYGVTESETVVDSFGDAHTVEFTRPVDLDMYVHVEYEVDEDPPEDIEDLIEAEILAFGLTLQPGDDVIPFKFEQHIETTGIRDLTLFVGVSPSPTSDEPIEVSRRAHAKFDSSRTTFERLN